MSYDKTRDSNVQIEDIKIKGGQINFDWFKTIVGIAIIVGGFFMNRLITELDQTRSSNEELKVIISAMKTDIDWIKTTLTNKK